MALRRERQVDQRRPRGMGRRSLCLLVGLLAAACAPPPLPHPAGELYLAKPDLPPAAPSTENDINGGAN